MTADPTCSREGCGHAASLHRGRQGCDACWAVRTWCGATRDEVHAAESAREAGWSR